MIPGAATASGEFGSSSTLGVSLLLLWSNPALPTFISLTIVVTGPLQNCRVISNQQPIFCPAFYAPIRSFRTRRRADDPAAANGRRSRL